MGILSVLSVNLRDGYEGLIGKGGVAE